jgi:hypothetical protein
MPDYTVQWIIGRALSDPVYRERMAQDPMAAWAGYELNKEDFAELKKWTPARIQAYLAEMEMKVVSAPFDGAAGFDLDEAPSPSNCDDMFSLDELKKLLGEDVK